jgi:para-aminobenzoate synthetase component 1
MKDAFREQLNSWGQAGVPFLFVIDFEGAKPLAWKLSEIDSEYILFDINSISNAPAGVPFTNPQIVGRNAAFSEYEPRFNFVQQHLYRGDSFLTNLTVATPIQLKGTLLDCFFASHAPYRLWMKDEFVLFSPEAFVKVRAGKIFSYPMKGTIDAKIKNAREQILGDEKELAEHVTIVDLIRNDLSAVASDVEVTKFRFIQEVKSESGNLLQVSSEISGNLSGSYGKSMGDLLAALLPAGSVSGAPKRKTCEIIRQAEGSPRGYYSGVCGIFDGVNLDSGVMIRFIEKSGDAYYYRSGGGITTQSDARKEWEETQKKIYVPVR